MTPEEMTDKREVNIDVISVSQVHDGSSSSDTTEYPSSNTHCNVNKTTEKSPVRGELKNKQNAADRFGNYSRFHSGSPANTKAPSARYTPEFRERIFKINPHNISCLYKPMFETHSVNSLRVLDEEVPVYEECIVDLEQKTPGANKAAWEIIHNKQCLSPLPLRQSAEHIDVSNSATFGPFVNVVHRSYDKKDFRGWDICHRPHSAGCAYRKDEEAGDGVHKVGKYGSRPDSPKSVFNNLKNIRSCHSNSRIGRAYVNPRKMSRDSPSEESSRSSTSSSSMIISPIKAGKFNHYTCADEYMDQYREEYTYKKLKENHPQSVDKYMCSCRNPVCPAYLASHQMVPKWYPIESQRFNPLNAPRHEESVVPYVSRPPILKKRPFSTQRMNETPKPGKNSRESILNMEFFTSPLIVNNYNPTRTPTMTKSPSPTTYNTRSQLPSSCSSAICPSPEQIIRGT